MMDCNLFNLTAAYIEVQRTLLKTFPFISTYLPTQEVLKYTLEYASIVHAQKIYQVQNKVLWFYYSFIEAINIYTLDKVSSLYFFLSLCCSPG